MNPNLYNNGAVCLSLLNTWHANDLREKWSSDSNLYQAGLRFYQLIEFIIAQEEILRNV